MVRVRTTVPIRVTTVENGRAIEVRGAPDHPALVGAWRDPAGGALLSSSGTYPVDHLALERPDLIRGKPHTINMSAIGDALRAARYPLAFISPPARNFLNSSFANLPTFVSEEASPKLDLNPADAAPRGIQEGDRVRIFNDRGSFTATARITDRARAGVAVAPSIWWQKLAPDGCNANAVTSQALTDLGRAATFYDCLVEVARA